MEMPRAKFLILPLLAGLLPLSACSSLLTQSAGAGAGVGGAAIAHAVHANGAVTTGIGLGAQAAATAAVQALEKTVHQKEQDAIAASAGAVPVGGLNTWSVHHRYPIEANEHGELTVTRLISPDVPAGAEPPFICKEIIFSVDSVQHKQPTKAFYTADICRDGAVWKWATAEPATERWGALQ